MSEFFTVIGPAIAYLVLAGSLGLLLVIFSESRKQFSLKRLMLFVTLVAVVIESCMIVLGFALHHFK